MKLKIKETGEILEDVKFIDTTLHKITIQYLDNGVLRECLIKNLSDVEEVKNYEEPKKHYWVIDDDGMLICRTVGDFTNEEMCKQIGNYFEAEKKAEKAVKKLEAWKRLKDKGFRFIPEASYVEQTEKTEESMMFIACAMNDCHDFIFGDNADIKLIFGGEE